MKNHPGFDILLDHSLGELGKQQEDAVRGHLAGCPDCRRELDAIGRLSSGFASLPQVEPGENVWPSLSESIGRERAGNLVLLLWAARLMRRPAVYGAISVLLVGSAALYLAARERHAPREADIAVVEMGSKIAHGGPGHEDLRSALESYYADSGEIVEEALRCAARGNEADFSILRDRIPENDLLYRASQLRERLSTRSPGDAGSAAPASEVSAHLALIADSAMFIRLLAGRSPEALARHGERIRFEAERMRLMERLRKGGRP